jgi:hypothetical protein
VDCHATLGEDELFIFTWAVPASVASPTFTPPVTVWLPVTNWSPFHSIVGTAPAGAAPSQIQSPTVNHKRRNALETTIFAHMV